MPPPSTTATAAVARRRRIEPARRRATAHGRTLAVGAPELGDWCVHRPRLVERLVAARDAALALIIAPPGYGKPVLLAEWEKQDPRPFIRVDARDCRWSNQEAVAARVRSPVAEHASAGAEAGVVIVLDDAELLAPETLKDAFELTRASLANACTVAIVGRGEPPLPPGRLRAHRGLVEIGTADLAMTTAEAEGLLRGAGIELEHAAVVSLVERTEGWPAALYLAALAIESGQEAASFDGSHHLIAEFVKDEVLASLPEGLQEFALSTAMLDELSGPVCDHALGTHDSARRIAQLASRGQLLVAVDPSRNAYRCQRVVADTLRGEPTRQTPTAQQRRCGRRSSPTSDAAARAPSSAGSGVWGTTRSQRSRGWPCAHRSWRLTPAPPPARGTGSAVPRGRSSGVCRAGGRKG